MDFAAILRKGGVAFVEQGDWRSRVRPGTFDPVGILVHHTASKPNTKTAVPSLKTVVNGRPDLNGPLCNFLVGRDGSIHIISAGKANHAGSGSAKVLADAKRGKAPRGTAAQLELTDDCDEGNSVWIGIEVECSGTGEKLSPEAWLALERLCAALLKFGLRKPASARVIGHAEWTRRKIDPLFGAGKTAYENTVELRRRVSARLGGT